MEEGWNWVQKMAIVRQVLYGDGQERVKHYKMNTCNSNHATPS